MQWEPLIFWLTKSGKTVNIFFVSVGKIRGNIRITSKANCASEIHTQPENHIKNTIISALGF